MSTVSELLTVGPALSKKLKSFCSFRYPNLRLTILVPCANFGACWTCCESDGERERNNELQTPKGEGCELVTTTCMVLFSPSWVASWFWPFWLSSSFIIYCLGCWFSADARANIFIFLLYLISSAVNFALSISRFNFKYIINIYHTFIILSIYSWTPFHNILPSLLIPSPKPFFISLPSALSPSTSSIMPISVSHPYSYLPKLLMDIPTPREALDYSIASTAFD